MTVIQSFDVSIPVRRFPPLSAEALTRELARLGLVVELPATLRIDDELRYLPVRITLEDGRVVKTGLSIVWSAPGDDDGDDEGETGEEDDDAEGGALEGDDEDEDEPDVDDEDDEDEEDADDADGDDDADADEQEDADEEDADEEDEDAYATDDDGPDSDELSDDDAEDSDETPLIDGQVGEVLIWAKNAPLPTDDNEVPLALYFAAAIARLGDGEVVVHAWEGGARSAEELAEELEPSFDAEREAWDEYPYELFLAAEDGDAARTGALLERGAPMEAMNNQGVTPLMVALQHDRAAAAWELLRHGANARAVNYFGKTAAQYADSCSDDWVRAEVARRARFPHDELFELIAEGDSNGVLAALAAGAPVDAATPEGFTLLMAAVQAADENLVDALLRRGAKVDPVTSSGATALEIAETLGHVAIQKLLRGRGRTRG